MNILRRIKGECTECGKKLDGWDRKWSLVPGACMPCGTELLAEREKQVVAELRQVLREQLNGKRE